MNGSNVMLIFPQSGQTSVDLSWPWNQSTTMELFLALWSCQASSAISCRYALVYPGLQACRAHLIGSASGIFSLDVRLLDNAVQILMKTVKQEPQKFLGVMLLVSRKLGCKVL